MKHPGLRLLALLAVFLLAVAGCASQPAAPAAPQPAQAEKAAPAPAVPAAAQPAAPAQPIKVRVGMASDTLGYAPLYIATTKGFFKDLGLDVERITLQGGSALNAAILAGDVDVAGTATNTAIELKKQGKDTMVVYALIKSQTMHLTVSQRFAQERGVEPKDKYEDKIKKLKGIVLGAPSLGGTTELYARYIMRRGGLSDADVSVVKTGSGSALVAAVENNQVDGFVSSPPAPFEAAERGKSVVLVTPKEIPEFSHYIHSAMITTETYANKNSAVIRKIVQGLDQGKKMIREDFEGAVQELKKSFPKMQEASLRYSLQFYQDTAYGTDGKMTVDAWKDTLAVMSEAEKDGLGGAKPDPAEGMYWTNKYQ